MCTKKYLYLGFAMFVTENDLEMIVLMGSSAQKGENGMQHPKKKGLCGEALYLTTSHLLVLVNKNVCS